MNMRKFVQNKLWRDKAITKLEEIGSKIHWTKLDDHEYDKQLRLKLLEETDEVVQAKTTKDLSNEIADVLEVVSALCSLHDLKLEEILKIKETKREERGGFDGRKFVTIAEHPVGGFGEKYCLADPEKYKEIVED